MLEYMLASLFPFVCVKVMALVHEAVSCRGKQAECVQPKFCVKLTVSVVSRVFGLAGLAGCELTSFDAGC